MNQHRSIVKAINLLLPVAASVAVRRPSGMSNADADVVTLGLRRALEALEDADARYERASDRKAS